MWLDYFFTNYRCKLAAKFLATQGIKCFQNGWYHFDVTEPPNTRPFVFEKQEFLRFARRKGWTPKYDF